MKESVAPSVQGGCVLRSVVVEKDRGGCSILVVSKNNNILGVISPSIGGWESLIGSGGLWSCVSRDFLDGGGH